MDIDSALNNAATNFVKAAHQERFIHEAKRKPAKLIGRICHDIDSLFDAKFRDGTCAFLNSDECLVLTIDGRLQILIWHEANALIEAGGGGLLIIDATGERFIALSEGFPPSHRYCGQANANKAK